MKRKLCLIFVLIFTLSALLSPSAFAEGISLYNNNVDTTTTSFSITDTGEAQVMAAYSGYSGVTTGATICIKIEKRTVERVVSYGVPQNGRSNEFLIDNHDIRALALRPNASSAVRKP